MAFKCIVFRDFAAGGKGAAERGNALDVTAELDLLGEESVAGLAIFGALVGEVRFIRSASSVAEMRMALSVIQFSFL